MGNVSENSMRCIRLFVRLVLIKGIIIVPVGSMHSSADGECNMMRHAVIDTASCGHFPESDNARVAGQVLISKV